MLFNSLAVSPPPVKKFTWEELAKHNTPEDAFIAIRGNVYDITKFIKNHPGGEDILLLAIGKDATQAFETYHELGKPDIILKKYYVGILTSNELPTFPEISDFHRTVKKRVEEYFEKNQIDPKNRIDIWIRYSFIFGAFIASYYAQFFVEYVVDQTWLQVICAAVMGFSLAQIGLNQLHDGTHFAVTHNPLIWKLLGATHDFFNGASNLVWQYQHSLGHHIYTNIEGADPDVVTADPDIRRIKPTQRWYSHYLNQQFFVPILYGFLAFKVRIQDINILYIMKSNDKIRVNPLSQWHTMIFWGGKLFFIFYRIIIPLALIPATKVLTLFVVADLVTSYWLALTFQANHVVDEVEWPLPDDKGFINKDWAEMQVVTTQDYAHDSFFWTSIVGSLNYQTVHHLFPQVSQHHYRDITPIVKATCKEFGIRFYYRDTFWDAFASHINHLRLLGIRPTEKKIN
ncbi:12566_t:CDS:10 [Ambispora leptoticha]|uniref:12566_t:CDS:1 n=1 Tax=Ambispora leptoticha TaxID=144679 RepID=A0A9N8VPL4_9GLOM|nr:12566_t:CDS:10 [Ambispora leptoticha]